MSDRNPGMDLGKCFNQFVVIFSPLLMGMPSARDGVLFYRMIDDGTI